MKLIDRETGESPVIRSGQSFSWEVTVINNELGLCEVPSAITIDGEEAAFAWVSTEG